MGKEKKTTFFGNKKKKLCVWTDKKEIIMKWTLGMQNLTLLRAK